MSNMLTIFLLLSSQSGSTQALRPRFLAKGIRTGLNRLAESMGSPNHRKAEFTLKKLDFLDPEQRALYQRIEQNKDQYFMSSFLKAQQEQRKRDVERVRHLERTLAHHIFCSLTNGKSIDVKAGVDELLGWQPDQDYLKARYERDLLKRGFCAKEVVTYSISQLKEASLHDQFKQLVYLCDDKNQSRQEMFYLRLYILKKRDPRLAKLVTTLLDSYSRLSKIAGQGANESLELYYSKRSYDIDKFLACFDSEENGYNLLRSYQLDIDDRCEAALKKFISSFPLNQFISCISYRNISALIQACRELKVLPAKPWPAFLTSQLEDLEKCIKKSEIVDE